MKDMMNKVTERTEFNDEEQRRYVLEKNTVYLAHLGRKELVRVCLVTLST